MLLSFLGRDEREFQRSERNVYFKGKYRWSLSKGYEKRPRNLGELRRQFFQSTRIY